MKMLLAIGAAVIAVVVIVLLVAVPDVTLKASLILLAVAVIGAAGAHLTT